MGLHDPKYCQKSGCTKSWDRDPVLEVSCPKCEADVGDSCKRPSGHQVWNGFGRFHKARDLKALEEGAYGECPMGRCPESIDELDKTITDDVDPRQEA